MCSRFEIAPSKTNQTAGHSQRKGTKTISIRQDCLPGLKRVKVIFSGFKTVRLRFEVTFFLDGNPEKLFEPKTVTENLAAKFGGPNWHPNATA